jgi:molybdenum cofactor biosynthesis enzyme
LFHSQNRNNPVDEEKKSNNQRNRLVVKGIVVLKREGMKLISNEELTLNTNPI